MSILIAFFLIIFENACLEFVSSKIPGFWSKFLNINYFPNYFSPRIPFSLMFAVRYTSYRILQKWRVP